MIRKKKTTQGRQKIAMEKIADEHARYICFSKRRNGIFTKSADLATLCGAEVAIILISQAGNYYSFGSPKVNEVVDRFLTNNSMESGSSSSRMIHGFRMNQVNQQVMELSQQIDFTKGKISLLETQLKTLVENSPICQLVDAIESLGLEELEKVEEWLVGVKEKLDGRTSETMSRGGLSSPNPTRVVNQFADG